MRSYSVLQDQESSNELTLQEHFSQTFTTGKAFDHIALWVANWDGAANDSVYDVTVWDESGVAVASGQVIGAEAPCMSAYTIAFDRIVPEQTQTYTIEVTLRNPDCVIRTGFPLLSECMGSLCRRCTVCTGRSGKRGSGFCCVCGKLKEN